MKKNVLIIMFLAISAYSFGQAQSYSEVIEQKGDAKTLHNKAKMWAVETFTDAKEVIQMDEFSDGKGTLVLKPLFSYNSNVFSGSATTRGVVRYTVKIFTKDGRYKYEITDFVHKSYGDNSFGLLTVKNYYPGKASLMYPKRWRNKVWMDLKKQSSKEAHQLINSLEESMSSKKEKVKDTDDNW